MTINKFNVNANKIEHWRYGRPVDMDRLLGDLDTAFNADLDASIRYYDVLDDVYNETDNDLMKVVAKLNMLYELWYIDKEEYEALTQCAREMRKCKIDEFKNRVTENKED